ncbi:MAG: LysR substrate-binding domain-containing protein [Gammaproteobacteria bacterium]
MISSESLKSLVESGAGVGLFFRESIEPSLRAGYLKAIEVPALKDLNFRYFVIRKKGGALSRNAQHFLTLLSRWSKNIDPSAVNRTGARLRLS